MKLRITISVGLLISAYIGYRVFLIYNPAIAYELITGKMLPKGVVAVHYASMLNGAFIHSGYYWEFRHDKAGMNKLLKQLGAGKEFESYEGVTNFQQYDVIWALPSIAKALGKSIPRSEIGKGYEIERRRSRDSDLLISKSGERSYYEFN